MALAAVMVDRCGGPALLVASTRAGAGPLDQEIVSSENLAGFGSQPVMLVGRYRPSLAGVRVGAAFPFAQQPHFW